MLAVILFIDAVGLAALIGTGLMYRYALRNDLLDHVNDRSAHKHPTPRGGGLAVVVVVILGLAFATIVFGLQRSLAIGMAGGGGMVALIGWLDDRGHVRPLLRLACHVAGALWLIGWLGPLPLEALGFDPVAPVLSWTISLLFVVWLINLYNFMDGLDGLAAGQVLSVCAAGLAITLVVGPVSISAWLPPLILAAAVCGFLPWNWPPARIFMGDASSGFLGFMLAALALAAHAVSSLPQRGLAWAILPSVFIADATVTLLRRLARRERVYEAHRSHAYQIWSQRLGQHLPVTVAMSAATLLWSFPIAYLVASGTLSPLAGGALAIVPLMVCMAALGAGKPTA